MLEKTRIDSRHTAGDITAPTTAWVLVAAIGVTWLIVMLAPVGMDTGPILFVVAWTTMMAAMMLPSAAPLVLLYRRGSSGKQTAFLTAGYLTVWAAAGVPAYYASGLMSMALAPVALVAAGLYQLTPLKQSCLERCRSPADFLVQRWGRGPLRLGMEHGLWCLGCCWGLMAVLVLVGSMGLVWVVALAAVVALEKLTRHGVAWSRATGVAFLIAALIQGMT